MTTGEERAMGMREESDRRSRPVAVDGGMVRSAAPLAGQDAGPFGGTRPRGIGHRLDSEGPETFRKTGLVWLDPQSGRLDLWWFPYTDAEAFPAPGRD